MTTNHQTSIASLAKKRRTYSAEFNGMANFLGVNTCYDNHQAVLIWTFQLLEREPALNELAEIKKYFLLIFPDSVYQLA